MFETGGYFSLEEQKCVISMIQELVSSSLCVLNVSYCPFLCWDPLNTLFSSLKTGFEFVSIADV